jgi:CBS domain-containing protein
MGDRVDGRSKDIERRSEEDPMTRVSEIMTSDVCVVNPEMTLRTALETLRARGVAGAPVVRGANVVGVVSAADLLEFEATMAPVPGFRPEQGEWDEPLEEDEAWAEGASPPLYFVELWRDSEADVVERMSDVAGPEWDFLADHTVAEAMTRALYSVEPEDDARAAARTMTDAGVHRVLVLEGGQLAGILSASDVVRAVAQGDL